MGLLKNLFRKEVEVPTEEKETLEAVKLWCVRWKSRHGSFNGDWKPAVECFTSREDAVTFATRLREAAALLKYSEELSINISEN